MYIYIIHHICILKKFEISCLTHCALSLGEPYYLSSLLIDRLNSHFLCYILTHLQYRYPASKKFNEAFALSLALHLSFEIIYLNLFVLLLYTLQSFRKNSSKFI